MPINFGPPNPMPMIRARQIVSCSWYGPPLECTAPWAESSGNHPTIADLISTGCKTRREWEEKYDPDALPYTQREPAPRASVWRRGLLWTGKWLIRMGGG